MTFDPFGDFEARGYLRNVAKAKDPEIVRRLQHNSFITGIDDAFDKLAARKRLSYDDMLGTHKILFEAVFPWAGEDRRTRLILPLARGRDLRISAGYTTIDRLRARTRAGRGVHDGQAR